MQPVQVEWRAVTPADYVAHLCAHHAVERVIEIPAPCGSTFHVTVFRGGSATGFWETAEGLEPPKDALFLSVGEPFAEYVRGVENFLGILVDIRSGGRILPV